MIIKEKTKTDKEKIKEKTIRNKTKEKQDVINFRVKSRVKREASKIFDKMGIDMSTALNIFLHNVMIRKAMPMQMITENRYTYAYEAEIMKASNEISDKSYSTVDEMLKDLDE